MTHVSSVVLGVATFAWTWGRTRPASDAGELAAPFNRAALLYGAIWSLAIVVAALANPHLPYRSDAWYHGGIIIDILDRGLPPEDPRFAGLPANYMWFYHLFIAFLTAAHATDPFVFMTLLNVVQAAACAWAAYALGWALWGNTRFATACMVLMTLGFSAGAWLLWPLRGIRGAIGETRGWSHVVEAYGPFDLGSWHVVDTLTPPLTHMVSFVDKFLVSTALSHAWVLTLVYLTAVVACLAAGKRAAFGLVTLSALGIMLFHGIVASSVMTAALASLALGLAFARGADRAASRRRAAGAGLATLVGCLIGTPYLTSVARGWAEDRSGMSHRLIQPGIEQSLTLVVSCGIVAVLAWQAWRRGLVPPDRPQAWIALHAGAMLLVALSVNLPDDNESKFAFLLFMPLAALGAPSLSTWIEGASASPRGRAVLAIVALIALFNPIATVYGFAVDPAGRTAPEMHPTDGEARLHAWLGTDTPTDAVLLDADYRDLLMVLGRRPMYLGTPRGPEKAAYPLSGILERREVMADVYGRAERLSESAATLRSMHRPVFIVFRPGESAAARERLTGRPDLFERVYDRDGFEVFRVRGGAAAS